jgi:putative glycosyltransferase (TIGR04348 family)
MEGLGHQVDVGQETSCEPCDLLVAFNATRNRSAIMEAKRTESARSIVICLTGTDLYRDFHEDPGTRDVLFLADRLVVLHPLALDELPPELRSRTSVILQSAVRPPAGPAPSEDTFDVCVIAHLRDVKDPLRAALAARMLPPGSRIRVLLVGRSLTDEYTRAAEAEARTNPRFHWLGEQPEERTAEILLQSRLSVVSSLMEGGSNVVSESIISDVPVVVTRIPCMVGLLGSTYPGFFPVMDTKGLAQLMMQAESDQKFYDVLREDCRRVAYRFDPSLEREQIGEMIGLAVRQ